MNKPKVSYNAGEGIIEIVIRDENGSKEMKFKANQSDTKSLRHIARILRNKYDIEICDHDKEGFFDF